MTPTGCLLLRHCLLLGLLAGSAIAQNANSGIVEGSVARWGTNEPLPGATVQLQPLNEPETYVVQSAGGGRFEFRNIPPGEYELSAVHSGFVRAEYGKRRSTDPWMTLTVESSRTTANVRLTMVQAGAIAGHVIDSRGEPLAAAVVRAFQNAFVEGQRALRVVQTVTTDDLGNYRLYSLPPGRYYVSAVILSEDATAPAFYPETSDPRLAEGIDVSAGSTVGGVNIAVRAQPFRHIRGTVLFSGSGAATATVQIAPKVPILNASPIAVAVNQSTGGFDVPSMAPGSYVLTAISETLSAQASIDVGNTDVNDVRIAIASPIEIPVHVALDPASAGPDRIDVSDISFGVRVDPRVPDVPEAIYITNQNDFSIRVTPGEYRIVAQAIPSHAYIQRIRLGTSDVLDKGLHIDSNVEGRLEIVIGANPGMLEGIVTTNQKQPAPNTILVLAPDEEHRQRLELFKTVYTDATGRFKVEDIPPGDYTVFSWEDVEPFSWMNPEFMRAYDNMGRAIHIEPGTRQSVQITAISQE